MQSVRRSVRRGIATAVLSGIVFVGAAAHADNNVGCGLGTQLWAGKSELAFQVLAATTNGTFGNQTFGISSETLDCKRDQVITVQHRRSMFVGANIDRLSRDMALGEGESLEALADLMDIAAADRPVFYRLTKQNFAAIVPSARVTAGEVLENLDRLMAESPELRRYVRS